MCVCVCVCVSVSLCKILVPLTISSPKNRSMRNFCHKTRCLISHYRFSRKPRRLCFAKWTFVRKHIAYPLQTKYHHITCLTLQLLLHTISCFILGPLTIRARCDDQWLQRIHGTYVSCSGTHGSPITGSPTSIRRSHIQRQQAFL